MKRAAYLVLWAITLSAWVVPCAVAGASEGAGGAVANEPVQVDALTRLAQRLAAPDPQAEAPPAPDARLHDSMSAMSQTPSPGQGTVSTERMGESRPLGMSFSPDASSPLINPSAGTRQDGEWVLSTLTALGLVIGLILLARWGWMKMGGTVTARSSGVVEVLSRTTVAPRNQVLLLRVGGRVLVVGDSAAGLRTLSTIEDPDEVASVLEAVTAARANSISKGFSQLLSHTDRDFSQAQRLAEEGGDHNEYRFDRARDSVSSLLSRIRAMSQKGGA